MANFLPMQSSPFGQMNLYTPDWSFLTTVMGTRQAEYDRGFNMVKSAYDNLKYAPLTNPENMEQREYAFKQLESNLKSTANLDLSNSVNITKAIGIMDPISDDKAIVYDMAYTKAMGSERDRMNAIKNSTDPEIRKQYNRYSEMEMNYADLNMQEAHRNDNSVFEIKPVKHVPYKDYIGDLNKKMKDAGIKIKMSGPSGDGYIIETVNGEMSIPYFNAWAQAQMGEDYDEQFAVMGRVQTESAIRSNMDTYGLNRKDAMAYVAEQMSPLLAEKEAQKELAYNKDYTYTLNQMSALEAEFRKAGLNGIPANRQAEWDALILKKEGLESIIETTITDKLNLQDPEYVLSNLSYYMGNNFKDQHVQEWASTMAMATAEENISSDATWVAKFKESNANWRHTDKLDWDKQKFYTKLQYDLMTGTANTESTVAKLFSGDATVVSTYTPTEGQIFKADMLDQSKIKAQDDLFNSIVAEDGGLLYTMLQLNAKDGDLTLQKQKEYTKALSDLKAYGDSGSSILPYSNAATLNTINKMITDLGLDVQPLKVAMGKGGASAYINELNTAIYEKAGEKNNQLKGTPLVQSPLYQSLNNTYQQIQNNVDVITDIENFWDNVGPGLIKEGIFYTTPLNITGFTKKGNPIIDVSRMNDAQKNLMESFIPNAYTSGVPVTSLYKIENPNTEVFTYLLNENAVKEGSVKAEGAFDEDMIFDNSGNIDSKLLSAMYGNNLKAAVDPIDNTMYFEMVQGQVGKKGEVDYGKISFKVPLSYIETQPLLKKQFANIIADNQLETTEIGGEWARLAKDPSYVVRNTQYSEDQGFKYEVASNRTGGYTFNYSMLNPQDGKWYTSSSTVDVATTQEGIMQLRNTIQGIEDTYLQGKNNLVIQQYKQSDVIPFYYGSKQ